MILGFSTQINGKPTYFIERIWQGLLNKEFNLLAYHRFKDDAAYADVIDKWDHKKDILPKLHTIREDKTNRWKAGTKIDFFINVRKKNMFRFAPVLPVVSTQKIEIIYSGGSLNYASIYIDGELFLNNYNPHQVIKGIKSDDEKEEIIIKLAQNDGFDTIEDFVSYFDKDFEGKIIHWTDLKY
jgi:hypothetical protein